MTRPPLLRARMTLLWEGLWPALWPIFGVIALFLCLAFSGLLPALPGWLHAAILLGFALALGHAVWRARRAVRWPNLDAARRRIESASGLSGRPLSALADRLDAGRGDRVAEGLWRAHRRRLLARLGDLRAGTPHPGLARHDPLALRGGLLVLFIATLVFAGASAPDRVMQALSPDFRGADARTITAVEVWITPPPHTGQPPVFLDHAIRTVDETATTALAVPVTSKVVARVHGSRGRPVLGLGTQETDFSPLDGETYQIESEVLASGRLAVRVGDTELAGRDLTVVPDLPPTVEFALAPGRSQRDALRLEYLAGDDYGVVGVRAEIRLLAADGKTPAVSTPMVLDLPLPGIHVMAAEGSSYHDLTPHPWAGLPVQIGLVAEDAVGQTGNSDFVTTVLPARLFQHPVAQAIVEQRRLLTLDDSADTRADVAASLRELAARPSHYFDDKVVFLSLVTAAARLDYDDVTGAAVERVQNLLWDTALRIEDGELSLAERDLRAAQEALLEALARGADDSEIQELIDAVEQALDRFIEAMLQEMRDNPDALAEGEGIPEDAMSLQYQDLKDLLDQAREMARNGDTQGARDLMAQLQDILENMRMMAQPGGEGRGEMNEMLRELGDLVRRQQDLMDDTFQQMQQEQQGQSQSGSQTQSSQYGENAMSQDELRRQLGELMRRFGENFGEIPQEFGGAEQSMRRAQDSLMRSLPQEAVGAQGEALDLLREGGRAMARGQQGLARGNDGTGNGFDRDPFGRPLPGFGPTDTQQVDIPDVSDTQRAKEIVDELRRRAGERDRPELELEYIDRLLRQF